VSPEAQDALYVQAGGSPYLNLGGTDAPSVEAFLNPTRIAPAPAPPPAGAVPIDIQLVGELNQWQRTVRTAVLEYLWLRSVLERGVRLRQRLEMGTPSVTDVRDDLDVVDAAFYLSPRQDTSWPAEASAALQRMRNLLDAPDGPYLNPAADMAAFHTQVRKEVATVLSSVQRELSQLEQQARDAVEHLGSVVDVIFHSARDAQARAETEHLQQFARALGQGAAKASVSLPALARDADVDVDSKATGHTAVTGLGTYPGGAR
jgi:hypothetical protein